jgi:hypothetical protein
MNLSFIMLQAASATSGGIGGFGGILVLVIIITVVIVAIVNAGKKRKQRHEEDLREMYSQNDSQGNFRIEAIRNLKETGKPFDEYDVELEMERIKSSGRQDVSEEVRSSGNISQGRQQIIINQLQSQSNGTGTAGFVLALIAIFLGWIPVLGWILWILGLIFSCVGMSKQPKGLATAGLVLSLIDLILLLVVFGAIGALLGGFLGGFFG